MKVIDLLNKIANGEEVPQIVSYEGKKYHIDELEHFYVNDDRQALLEYIFDDFNDYDALMREVEILEEPKGIPEKMMMCTSGIMSYEAVEHITTELKDKYNEIIDYLKSKGE